MNTATWLRASMHVLVAATIACGASSPSVAAGHRTIEVGQDRAGQTIQAKVGDTVRVKLQEEFGPVPGIALVWDVSTSASTVLKLDNVARDPAERPRSGEVKYTADFSATKAGEAKLFARGSQTCEAMAAPACKNKEFTITVVVS